MVTPSERTEDLEIVFGCPKSATRGSFDGITLENVAACARHDGTVSPWVVCPSAAALCVSRRPHAPRERKGSRPQTTGTSAMPAAKHASARITRIPTRSWRIAPAPSAAMIGYVPDTGETRAAGPSAYAIVRVYPPTTPVANVNAVIATTRRGTGSRVTLSGRRHAKYASAVTPSAIP